jgi:hypothetical protein
MRASHKARPAPGVSGKRASKDDRLGGAIHGKDTQDESYGQDLLAEVETLFAWREGLEERLRIAQLKVSAGALDPSFKDLQAEIGEWVHISQALAFAISNWGRSG